MQARMLKENEEALINIQFWKPRLSDKINSVMEILDEPTVKKLIESKTISELNDLVELIKDLVNKDFFIEKENKLYFNDKKTWNGDELLNDLRPAFQKIGYKFSDTTHVNFKPYGHSLYQLICVNSITSDIFALGKAYQKLADNAVVLNESKSDETNTQTSHASIFSMIKKQDDGTSSAADKERIKALEAEVATLKTENAGLRDHIQVLEQVLENNNPKKLYVKIGEEDEEEHKAECPPPAYTPSPK